MGVKVTGQFEPAGSFSIVDGKDVSGNITGSNISGSGTGSFGTVGIGTNSPSAETKLHLYGNANADVKLKIENDFSGKNAVLVVDGGNGGDAIIHLAEANTVKGIITYDGGTDVLKIINDGSTASTHLAISSSGNVGMGTFSPDEKLEVVGNISASGDITGDTVTGNIVSSVGGLGNYKTISSDQTIPADFNAVLYSSTYNPITISAGVNYTVSAGADVAILSMNNI